MFKTLNQVLFNTLFDKNINTMPYVNHFGEAIENYELENIKSLKTLIKWETDISDIEYNFLRLRVSTREY